MKGPVLRLGLAAVLVTSVLVASPAARACGGFFRETSSSEVTAMSDIRVLLVRTQGRVEQYVQIAYTGKAARFAWVYPVAANPEVSEATSSPLASLEEQTRPQVTIVTPHYDGGGGGFGCGAADKAGSLGDRNVVPPKVTVWQSGQVGAFDYVVVSAAAAGELLAWLNGNGFAVPPTTTAVLDHYLRLGWVFVAMKVSVQSLGSGEIPSTTTIKLGYAAGELRYPLRMISLSAASETKLELYVINDDGVVPSQPWTESLVDGLRATSSTTHNYDECFANALAKNGGRTLVREFSSTEWQPGKAGLSLQSYAPRLTRFRAVLRPEHLDQDLVFVEHAGSIVWPHYELTFVAEKQGGAPLPLLLALLVGGGLCWRRARRRAR